MVTIILLIWGIVNLILASATTMPPPTRIALIDISASTNESLPAYKEKFDQDTRDFALQNQKVQNQQSTLDVILVGGDPLAESLIRNYTFSTNATGNFANADLLQQADNINKKVGDLLDNPPIKNLDSTALLQSLLLADREAARVKGTEPLDIVVYSDGVENSTDMSMLDSKQLDDATINSTLDRLQNKGLMPLNLSGVPIRFPLLGYHPGGSQVDLVKLERFWRAWAKRTGANLTVG